MNINSEVISVNFITNYHNVYVLFYKNIPIYVGCTSDVKYRINQHKYDKKNFDSYQIIFISPNRKEALRFELICIYFLKAFDSDCLNKQINPCSKQRIFI